MISFGYIWCVQWMVTMLLTMGPPVETGYATGIQFYEGSLPEARVQAAAEDKLIFIEVYADWCTVCKVMEESTFRDPEVMDLIDAHFLAWKVNIESTQGKLFAIQEDVQVLPALLILDAQGQKLMQIDQALQPKALLKMLKSHL